MESSMRALGVSILLSFAVFGCNRTDAARTPSWPEALEHFPLVLSTRSWYFSRSGGADGRGVFDGPADTRAEGFRRGSRVEGTRRAVSRQPGVGRCTEAATSRNGRIRTAQTDEISRSRARDGRSGSVGGVDGGTTGCHARGDPRDAADVGRPHHDLARPQTARFHVQKKPYTPTNNGGPTSSLTADAGATGCRCGTYASTSSLMN